MQSTNTSLSAYNFSPLSQIRSIRTSNLAMWFQKYMMVSFSTPQTSGLIQRVVVFLVMQLTVTTCFFVGNSQIFFIGNSKNPISSNYVLSSSCIFSAIGRKYSSQCQLSFSPTLQPTLASTALALTSQSLLFNPNTEWNLTFKKPFLDISMVSLLLSRKLDHCRNSAMYFIRLSQFQAAMSWPLSTSIRVRFFRGLLSTSERQRLRQRSGLERRMSLRLQRRVTLPQQVEKLSRMESFQWERALLNRQALPSVLIEFRPALFYRSSFQIQMELMALLQKRKAFSSVTMSYTEKRSFKDVNTSLYFLVRQGGELINRTCWTKEAISGHKARYD